MLSATLLVDTLSDGSPYKHETIALWCAHFPSVTDLMVPPETLCQRPEILLGWLTGVTILIACYFILTIPQ